jgi:acyl-CoA synthetase (AMP-forming)/AMP-acid ligase II
MHAYPPDAADAFLRDGWWSGQVWDDHLRRQVAATPDKSSLVDPPNKVELTGDAPRRLTWVEVDALVERTARRLFEHGVREGDVVGVQLPNVVELPVALLAVTRLGAVVTPFPVQYRRHELVTMGGRAGIVAFLTTARAVGRDLAAEAVALAPELPSLRAVLTFGATAVDGAVNVEAGPDGEPEGFAAYVAGRTPSPNDTATLAWTSGTEGVPKGVPRAHGDWEVVGRATSQSPHLTGDDVLLNLFPMVNAGGLGGMFMPWLLLGCTLAQHHPFSLDVFLGQIEEERVTYTCAPPLVLDTLMGDDALYSRRDLSTLRAVGSGSAPLNGWMIEKWEKEHGVEVLNLFGSNEGGILFADPDTVPDPYERGRLFPRYGVPGMPFRHDVAHAMQGRLVDLDDGSEITEPGRPGELRLKGPTIFPGYWGQGRDGFDDDGWFCTGDVFEISADRPDYLVHVDRAKDIIVRAGYKISAAELEALVSADPAVAEVAAVAVPDARTGEKVCLFVVPAPGHEPPTLESVVAALRAQDVATFKLPERLEVVDALPRNPVGKVLKRELRDRLAAAATGG